MRSPAAECDDSHGRQIATAYVAWWSMREPPLRGHVPRLTASVRRLRRKLAANCRRLREQAELTLEQAAPDPRRAARRRTNCPSAASVLSHVRACRRPMSQPPVLRVL